MASRLSDETLLSAYDRGLASFDWQAANLPSPMDEERGARALLDGLLSTEDAGTQVQAIEPSLIRHLILTAGIEEHLDLLPLLSQEQVTHMMDFEGWDAEQLSPSGAARWLQLHKQSKPEELFRRFRELEEEFQMGLLGPLVETFDLEAYEKMGDADQDALLRLPCEEVFYKIKSQDPEVRQFVEELVGQALAQDIEYAYSMLAHASYLPPSEQESLALRFRNARLEEEGFVTPEDASRLFLASAGEDAILRWTGSNVAQLMDRLICSAAGSNARSNTSLNDSTSISTFVKSPQTRMTLEAALAASNPEASGSLAVSLSHLANTLAVATGLDADNHQGLRLVLAHTKGYCNLGLELLASPGAESGTPSLIETATRVVSKEHPATLFKASIAALDEARRRTLDMLEAAGLLTPEITQRIRRLLFSRKYGMIMTTLDFEALPTLGLEATEILKGLFNRFPLCPTTDMTGDRMTFKPVYDLATLADLLRWTEQLKNISPTVH